MLGNDFYDVPAGKVAMVVTHLEMMAHPTLRDVAPPGGISFRSVPADVGWYRDVLDRVGRDWLWFARRRLSDNDLMDIISNPDVALFTLSIDGQDEAMLELDFRKENECEIAFFGLTSKLIGTGAGRYLMNQAITLAWDRPIERLYVHTCTSDSQQALAFYCRSGFTPYRLQVEIDDDPRLTGLLPEDAAPHVPMIR